MSAVIKSNANIRIQILKSYGFDAKVAPYLQYNIVTFADMNGDFDEVCIDLVKAHVTTYLSAKKKQQAEEKKNKSWWQKLFG